MHSMLLVGPYDWDPSVLPKEEFSERLAAFWQRMPGACKGVVIYGDSRAHAELAYLTGFVPKVRHAMALVAREGDPVMLVPGSRAGLISAKRLTWTQNVDLLGDPGKALAQWLDELGAEAAAIALIGGDYMRAPVRQPLLDALGKQALQDATPVLRALMQRKRPRELQAIRGACAMLKES